MQPLRAEYGWRDRTQAQGSRAFTPGMLLVVVIGSVVSMLPLPGPVAAYVFLAVASAAILAVRQTLRVLSPLALVSMAYVLAFPIVYVLPQSFFPDVWGRVSRDALEFGLQWGLRGFCALVAGYLLTEALVRRSGPHRTLTLSPSTLLFIQLLGILCVVGWLAEFFSYGMSLAFIDPERMDQAVRAEGIGQVWYTLKMMRYAFFSLIVALFLNTRIPRRILWILLPVLMLYAIDIIAIGSKTTIISGVVAIILGLGAARVDVRRRFWVGLIACLILIFGTFSLVSEYRRLMFAEYQSGHDVLSFTVQSRSFATAMANVLSPTEDTGDEAPSGTGTQAMLSRYSASISALSNLLQDTSRRSPLEYQTETLLLPLYSLLPRALYPDKPSFFDSGRNAREYYGWIFGGVSVTLPGSLYYSLGYSGILYGMFLVGVMLAYLYARFRRHGFQQPAWYALIALTTIALLDVGQTFHAIVANTIRYGIFLWIIHRLSLRARPRRSYR
jgi:hypothetical protein